MSDMDPAVLLTMITIIVSGLTITIGTLGPVIMEGKAVLKALEGMARQPEASSDIRTTLLIAMALLESTAIYVLLVVLILIFANPLLDQFIAS
jgi:F-type H+-transporting ATPase subunit c